MQLTQLPLAMAEATDGLYAVDQFLSQGGSPAPRAPMRLLFMPYGQGVYMAFVLKDWSDVQRVLNESPEQQTDAKQILEALQEQEG